MEEKDQAPNNQPTTAPMVDVQPPQQNQGPEPETSVADTPVAEAPATPPVGGDTDFSNEPVEETSSASADSPVSNPVTTPQLAAHNKRRGPVLVILLAIVLATALAGVAALAFMKKAPKPAQTNQTNQQSDNAVTTGTVDDAAKDADNAVNSVDESTDFPEEDLSDQTLGL